MASWKKVLTSGSNVDVARVTSSFLPDGTTDDKVIVVGSDGGFKKVAQSLIQGTTEATFLITGDSGVGNFDATSDTLQFTGSNGANAIISDLSNQTNVTFTLPNGTVSGSSQITAAQTIGFTSFSASLATDISASAADISNSQTDITSLQTNINDLVTTASLLFSTSESLAVAINQASASLDLVSQSISAINTFTSSVVSNDDTGSFLISASVLGTDNEVEVTAPGGAQSIQIGLPTNVIIEGNIQAGSLDIIGPQATDGEIAVVSGSTAFGNTADDKHQFTGSLQITGGLIIKNPVDSQISIANLTTSNTALPTDVIVRDSTTGILHKAGTAFQNAISGAFDGISASIATDIDGLDDSDVGANSTAIENLQTVSSSLITSASEGIFFQGVGTTTTGNSVKLGATASFLATGDGLSVDHAVNAQGNASITYTVNPQAIGSAIGAFSQSAQIEAALDDVYVRKDEAPISGAAQLQDLGFLTSSNFEQLSNVPTGLISASAVGSAQGQIKFNNVNVNIKDLQAGSSPTFNNLTITNNLTIKGNGISNLQVEQLNIEDQFILLNSGALSQGGTTVDRDKDGGIIVDQGGGSGSLFMYSFARRAWGFKGFESDATNTVNFNAENEEGAAIINPTVMVGVVTQSINDPSNANVFYGAGDYQKGQMHINTADDTIWVYV